MEDSFYFKTPIGILKITSLNDSLVSLEKVSHLKKNKKNIFLMEVRDQIKAYFEKKVTSFDIPLFLKGSVFQKKVWAQIQKIPYGSQLSYKELSLKISHKKAFRAVGSACGNNPIPLIVPCHRVVLSGGGVGSYAYGKKTKIYLLTNEQR